MLSEARLNAMAAVDKNIAAREVVGLLSKFLGMSELTDLGGVLADSSTAQASHSSVTPATSGSTAASMRRVGAEGAEAVGAAMQRGWRTMESVGASSVKNMRKLLNRERDASSPSRARDAPSSPPDSPSSEPMIAPGGSSSSAASGMTAARSGEAPRPFGATEDRARMAPRPAGSGATGSETAGRTDAGRRDTFVGAAASAEASAQRRARRASDVVGRQRRLEQLRARRKAASGQR
ncbi:RNA-binding transcriptional accessory protein [Gracilaria domingensis]|nr:RNA-binding transcriptional accessory protein [Gracilaria domingensis]